MGAPAPTRVGAPQPLVEAQVRLHGVNLADATHGLQMPGEVRTPAGRPDAPASRRESPHDMTAEESCTAEHGDQALLAARASGPG